jgi:hypothetical protein
MRLKPLVSRIAQTGRWLCEGADCIHLGSVRYCSGATPKEAVNKWRVWSGLLAAEKEAVAYAIEFEQSRRARRLDLLLARDNALAMIFAKEREEADSLLGAEERAEKARLDEEERLQNEVSTEVELRVRAIRRKEAIEARARERDRVLAEWREDAARERRENKRKALEARRWTIKRRTDAKMRRELRRGILDTDEPRFLLPYLFEDGVCLHEERRSEEMLH